MTRASKENFRNKHTVKKYTEMDVGDSGFNCVNWTEIKYTEFEVVCTVHHLKLYIYMYINQQDVQNSCD